MGLDLTLLPLRGPQQMGDTSVLCHDRLSFDRDYEIFGQLTDVGEGNKPTIKANSIPPQMWVETYEDEGIKRRRDDKYGTELTFVYAERLKKLKVSDDASAKNKAIKAFVEALPNDTPILLLWR
ncbi:hypothetical protein EPN83_00375 [Patescibacteria group bacterium]|nr:MAG: hypothetical protein EPN83_00375 [Patescibacteria group bacterium]